MPKDATRPPMTPADIRRQVVVEELDLAADARTAVVVKRTIRGIRYRGHLLAIPLDERRPIARPRALTSGAVRDTRPRISPDARTVAFVRSWPGDDDRLAALHLIPLDGGTPRRVRAGRHGGVGEIAWSPDGTRIAFTASVDPPRWIVGPIGARVRARVSTKDDDTPVARHVTRTDWRWDEEGHRDRWSHLWIVDLARGARPRQITSGDWGVSDITWHPDGRTMAFTADRGPEPDLHPRTTIWAVDVDAPEAAPHEILAPGGWAAHPAYSPDGRWVAALGVTVPEPLDDVSLTMLLAPADGSAAATPIDLAPDLDRPVSNWTDTDQTGWMVSGRHGPWWLDDETIVAVVSDRGRSHPRRFRLDRRSGRPVDGPTPLDRDTIATWPQIATHSLAVAAGTVAALTTDGTRAMELATVTWPDRGDERPALTTRSRIGSAWQGRFAPIEMRLVQAPGAGGPMDVWICSPADAGDAPLPTIVDVHGGPLGAWAPTPHIEVHLLASAGYRVVLPNIRGSATYGRDWIRPQLGDWGGVDAADVHAALDHVIDLGLADPARTGVMGLSYGGFMVNWLVGTTDRFRAAVSENGVTNQINDWANSDSGPEYDRASLLGDPFSQEGIDKLWRQSPLRNVTSVRTPLLMLQAEADMRCPAADNEQFFVALRQLGRTVEYVLYPDEYHVYASSGRPDRRIDRNERIRAWFDRYLRA
jgi:dipeptidyl aminopeptidase/acylaminoacyl peptidase